MKMVLNDKTRLKVALMDDKINQLCGYKTNALMSNLNSLTQFGSVEVGWRESCGTTDLTHKVYREWKKILTMLKKEGIVLKEERIKHDNAYATISGGFWNSIIYSIVSNGKVV